MRDLAVSSLYTSYIYHHKYNSIKQGFLKLTAFKKNMNNKIYENNYLLFIKYLPLFS